jgi:methylenetetrahydrofolate--tRNA-(uracil-5-)-methyltransferase
VRVALYEMRPGRHSTMHSTDLLGELTGTACLGVDSPDRATGLLVAELRMLGSLIAAAADRTRLNADSLFQVGRTAFSEFVTEQIVNHPLIELRRDEKRFGLGDTPTVIATGPATTSAVARGLHLLAGREFGFFYGATEPLIGADAVDLSLTWPGRRFGDPAQPEHINCAIHAAGYERMMGLLSSAPGVLPEGVRPQSVFHDYMPVELMPTHSEKPLNAGPLNPVGLVDPLTGEEPPAVYALGVDEADRSVYRVTSFATGLDCATQTEVLACARGLEHVRIVRYGRLHRAPLLPARGLLDGGYRLRHRPTVFIAGALSGLQGYAAVAGSGWLAGVNAARAATGQDPLTFPPECLNGALSRALREMPEGEPMPLAANFGMLPVSGDEEGSKAQRRATRASRALDGLAHLLRQIDLEPGASG